MSHQFRILLVSVATALAALFGSRGAEAQKFPGLAPSLAVAFLNRGRTTAALRYRWSEHRIEDSVSKTDFDFQKVTYRVRNLWTHKALGSTKTDLRLQVPAHDVVMLRLSP